MQELRNMMSQKLLLSADDGRQKAIVAKQYEGVRGWKKWDGIESESEQIFIGVLRGGM